MPTFFRSGKASRPLRKSSGMWCDWSNSTALVRHACCSSRQFDHSAGTGEAPGRMRACAPAGWLYM
jgi:hypothetical protein